MRPAEPRPREQQPGRLVPLSGESLTAEKTRVVLDNTYPTRVSRYAVIRMAHAHRVPVRCRFLNTPLNEAYRNVVLRILERYGRLPGPDDLKELSKTDPNLPPGGHGSLGGQLRAASARRGILGRAGILFIRRPGRAGTVKGLLLHVEGTLRTTRSGEIYPRQPDDVQLLPGRREVLQHWVEAGTHLLGLTDENPSL